MRRRLRILCLVPLLLAAGVQAQTFRDPMRPPGSTPASARVAGPVALKLEGVISGAVRVAIVNGRLVRAGDSVAGAQIIEVLSDGVRYLRAGRVQTLLLPEVRALTGVRVARSPEATKP
ncbi:MAG: hypothetical protein ABI769_19105 [Pseudomonadota bacterium]